MTESFLKQDYKNKSLSGILAQRGDMVVRMAANAQEKEAAQKLRYEVFYQEMGATASPEHLLSRKDVDRFDPFCDHLLVIAPHTTPQTAAPENENPMVLPDGLLLATCRLLPQESATQAGGFYTEDEFSISTLIARKPELRYVELGRSCVLSAYRTPLVIDLLWRGIWRYVRVNGFDVMFGCASLHGTNPQHLAQELSLLAYDFSPPPAWNVQAVSHRSIPMQQIAESEVDRKKAMRALPPLIKGYLRLGCFIGEGAVLDPLFKTIDVLILMPVLHVSPRYSAYLDKATHFTPHSP